MVRPQPFSHSRLSSPHQFTGTYRAGPEALQALPALPALPTLLQRVPTTCPPPTRSHNVHPSGDFDRFAVPLVLTSPPRRRRVGVFVQPSETLRGSEHDCRDHIARAAGCEPFRSGARAAAAASGGGQTVEVKPSRNVSPVRFQGRGRGRGISRPSSPPQAGFGRGVRRR